MAQNSEQVIALCPSKILWLKKYIWDLSETVLWFLQSHLLMCLRQYLDCSNLFDALNDAFLYCDNKAYYFSYLASH